MQRPSLLKESMTRRWFTPFPMFLLKVRADGGELPLRDPRHSINRRLCSGRVPASDQYAALRDKEFCACPHDGGDGMDITSSID